MLAAIAGFDALDETSIRTPYVSKPSRRAVPGRAVLEGRRIGVIRPNFKTDGDEEVDLSFSVALETLRGLGARLEETELKDYPYGAIATTIYSAEAASIFRPLIQSEKLQQLVDESQRVGLIAALSIPANDYLDCCRLRGLIQADMAKMFERFDILVAPSRAELAPRADAKFDEVPPAKTPSGKTPEKSAEKDAPKPAPNPAHDDKHSIIAASNIAGLPAISIPCGFTKKNLPIGIQFVADALGEDSCLGFARDFQKATDWHTRRPSGF